MDVKRAEPAQVAESAVRALDLSDAGVDLFAPEALAASVRRAASFLCPTTRWRIIQSVLEVLDGLPGWSEATRTDLEAMLDSLVGYGDLLELPASASDSAGRQIFLGPPCFVARESGSCLLVGVRPDGAALVGDELSALIEYERHARIIRPDGSMDIADMLAATDLRELSPAQWLQGPREATASVIVDDHLRRLQAAGPCGDIENLKIIDTSAPVTYYRGRWRPVASGDDGYYVGRRPQAFGADLWCFAAISGGHPVRLIDLPLGMSLAPAADEAWRLQAALDALADHPQRVRVRDGAGTPGLDFFSPLPSWAQRHLDVAGKPLLRSAGALFSYAVPREDVHEELRFLRDMLWMTAD
jgi:hypothetical protein